MTHSVSSDVEADFDRQRLDVARLIGTLDRRKSRGGFEANPTSLDLRADRTLRAAVGCQA